MTPPARVILAIAIVLAGCAAMRAEAAGDRSCLWKATRGSHTLYLIGSIHYLNQEAYPLKRSMGEAFAEARVLVFEMDLDGAETGAGSLPLLNRGVFADGRTLQGALSDRTYRLAEAKTRAMGLDIALFAQAKPWFLTLTLVTLKLQQLGFDPAHGIDRYFYDRAKQANKEIRAFETMEEQIDLLDGMSPRAQEQFLLQTLQELDDADREVSRLVAAWKIGDARTLEEITFASFREFPEIYDRLLTARNRAWFERIGPLVNANRTTLLVVGVGHLLGPGGLLDLLRRGGYAVEQR